MAEYIAVRENGEQAARQGYAIRYPALAVVELEDPGLAQQKAREWKTAQHQNGQRYTTA